MPIMRGPIHSASASAVIAARMPRSVRYWKTWKNDRRLARYSVRSSSIASVPRAHERRHDAFQAVDAGSLDQHGSAGGQLGLNARDQQVDVRKPFRSRAKTCRGARGRRTNAEQPGYPAVACIGANILVGLGGLF